MGLVAVVTYSGMKVLSLYEPIRAEGAKNKIRQFNFKLTLNGLLCKGRNLSLLTIEW